MEDTNIIVKMESNTGIDVTIDSTPVQVQTTVSPNVSVVTTLSSNAAPGKSAYEIWLDLGHTGTMEDFLNEYTSYVHPTTHSASMITETADKVFITQAQRASLLANEHTHANKALLDAITAFFTSQEKTKLAGIESNAEVNNISDSNALDLTDGGDSSLHYHSSDRNRSNHTGTQLASTISDLTNAINTNVNVAANTAVRHQQNTDSGTSSISFQINNDSNGPALFDNAGTLEVKNSANSEYRDISVANIKNVYKISMNSSTSYPPTLVGEMGWNEIDGTIDIRLKNNVTLQSGQELHIYGRAIENINNGDSVQVAGIEGNYLLIKKAVGSEIALNPRLLLGIATQPILQYNNGYVTWFGKINDIYTPGWSVNDILYFDPNVIGGLTNVRPTAPNPKIELARVIKVADSGLENGKIMVRGDISKSLASLDDVEIANLDQDDGIRWNASTSRFEKVSLYSKLETDALLYAGNIDVEDAGNYFVGTEAETVLQQVGAEIKDLYKNLYHTMSTGVTSFGGLSINVDNTKFDIGPAEGYIMDNETDDNNPTQIDVNFAGAVGVLSPYIATDDQTQIYLNTANQIVMVPGEATPIDRRQMIFLGRIIHVNHSTINVVENTTDFVISPNSQLRDLWEAIGLISIDNYVYPQNGDLSLSLHGGSIYYSGVNFINNKRSPNKKGIASQATLTFNYRTQLGGGITGATLISPNYYDVNGVVTSMNTLPTNTSTNQRVFLTSGSVVVIQYGQTTYPTLEDAIAGIATESFVTYEPLKLNAALIGVISIKKTATDLSDTAKVVFHPVSKFGIMSGSGGGGSGAVNAVDVAVVDAADYYTTTNVESILQEIGYALTQKANLSHTHDDRYYTETEIDTKVKQLQAFAIAMSIALG